MQVSFRVIGSTQYPCYLLKLKVEVKYQESCPISPAQLLIKTKTFIFNEKLHYNLSTRVPIIEKC